MNADRRLEKLGSPLPPPGRLSHDRQGRRAMSARGRDPRDSPELVTKTFETFILGKEP